MLTRHLTTQSRIEQSNILYLLSPILRRQHSEFSDPFQGYVSNTPGVNSTDREASITIPSDLPGSDSGSHSRFHTTPTRLSLRQNPLIDGGMEGRKKRRGRRGGEKLASYSQIKGFLVFFVFLERDSVVNKLFQP